MKKKRIRFASVALTMIMATAMVLGLFTQGTTTLKAAETSIADKSTHQTWSEYKTDTTEYIGRIWTDKSVTDSAFDLSPANIRVEVDKDTQSDFLVMLSALSSASNTHSTTSKPLDIVLVLDTSGSMAEDITSLSEEYSRLNNNATAYTAYGYAETDNLYYRNDDEEYIPVTVERDTIGSIEVLFWTDYYYRYTFTAEGVEEAVAEDSVNSSWGGQQIDRVDVPSPYNRNLYYHRETNISKLNALKNAVSNFIDLTNEANTSITNDDSKHRISIVSYASSAYRRQGLTTVTDQTSQDLKGVVNSLRASGSTGADYAMNTTSDVLNTARSNAQKVVIFFTDGEPNHQNGFDRTVANATIETAGRLKQNGTLIYSVGVFEDADPSDTQNRFNGFMHGVSSNYPNATAYNSLGARAEGTEGDGSYYKAASDSESLNVVFSQIFDSINKGSGSPTEVGGEGERPENASGYITFTDTLGKYMHVTGFDSIVYANTRYEFNENDPQAVTVDGNVTTYKFNQQVEGNGVYEGANLSNIIIQVEKVNDDQEVVTVKIPASLIPLRYFNVVSKDGELTVTKTEPYPIRIFYNVKLDDDVTSEVINGTFDDTGYLNSHISDGKLNFYSNEYTSGSYGTTTATFTPSTGNNFYYFTEDTPLYSVANDENSVVGENEFRDGQTYYYQQEVYKIENGSPSSEVVYFKVTGLTDRLAHYDEELGQWVVNQGTRKNPNDYNSDNQTVNIEATKEANETETAPYAISPVWNDTQVSVRLGNNGRIQVDVPGSLRINKIVNAAEGFEGSLADFNDTTFNFKVTFTGINNTEYSYYQYTDDTSKGAVRTMEDDGDGIVEFTLLGGETIEFIGLPKDVQYKVEETADVNFSSQVDDKGTGVIVANDQSVVDVTNTLTAGDVTLDAASASLNVRKLFEGRDTTDTDEFTFEINPRDYSGLTMPDQNTVSVTMGDQTYVQGNQLKSNAVSFGNITFTEPGNYVFEVTERYDPAIPGVSYSGDIYYITIPVTVEKGEANLKIGQITYYKNNPEAIYNYKAEGALEFTNTFNAKTQTTTITGTKILDAVNSDMQLSANDFSFKITSVKVNDQVYTSNDDLTGIPMPVLNGETANFDTVFYNDEYGRINIGVLTYDGDDIGRTYTYTIKEINDDKTGYTYDSTPKEIVAVVTGNTVGSGVETNVNVTGNNFVFENKYEPEKVTIGENTNNALTVSKTIDGRPWNDDSFEFTLTGLNNAPMPNDNPNDNKVTINVQNGDEGTAQTAFFGDIEFSSEGVYTYNIKETKGDKAGLTYDGRTSTVVVTVKDDNGQLVVESIVYDNDDSLTSSNFVNIYEAQGTGNITIVKKIDGRDFTTEDSKPYNGGFVFNITADENNGDGVTFPAGEETKTLTNADEKVEGEGDNVRKDMLDESIVFTKPGTYTFNVQEQIPANDEDKIPGITYDQSVQSVTYTVTDNYNGTLNVVASGSTDSMGTVEFTNTYTSGGTSTEIDPISQLTVTKHISGGQWLDNETFQFTIEALDNAPLPQETTIEIGKPENGTTNDGKFGVIEFNAPGTYKYRISEEAGNRNGMDYSQGVYELAIVVEDNPQLGRLQIVAQDLKVIVDREGQQLDTPNDATNVYFTNYYSATGTYELKVHKNLEGRDEWIDLDQYKFTIAPADSTTTNAINDSTVTLANNEVTVTKDSADHTVLFGNITFNKSGTYKFVVSEDTTSTIPGVTYGTETQEITFVVSDNNDGTLSVEPQGVTDNTVSFTNTYTPAEVTLEGNVDLGVKKVLDGRKMTADDEFTFTIEKADANSNAPLPENTTITLNGVADASEVTGNFGNITYTEDGVYVYKVKETVPADTKGIEYDTTEYTVTVTVTDNAQEGKLETRVEITNATDGVMVFTNTYKPEGSFDSDNPDSANLVVTKTFEGREDDEWLDTDTFSFTLTPDAEAAEAKAKGAWSYADETVCSNDEDSCTIEITAADVAHSKAFSDLNFTKDGEYKFTVTEIEGSIAGVTYDDTSYAVTISVTDDGEGNLTATATRTDTSGAINFKNTYDSKSTEIVIPVIKKLVNIDWTTPFDSFTFKVTPKDSFTESNAMINGEAITDENNSIVIDAKAQDYEGTFKIQAKEPGLYQFTISEVTGETQGRNGTLAYGNSVDVTVQVDDDNQGGLTVGTVQTATITNTYTPKTEDGALNLAATKKIEGARTELIYTDVYEFVLEADDTVENNSAADKLENGSITATNNLAGEISFGTLSFDLNDVGKTFVYKVSEVAKNENGVTSDTTVYTVNVEVSYDSATGKLSVTPTYNDGAADQDAIVFTNTYEVTPVTIGADLSINAKKTVTGDPYTMQGGEFEFSVTPADGNPENDPLANGLTVTNNQDGSVALINDVTFTSAGTYTYTIREVTGTDEHIGYDDVSYEVVYTVTDNKDGTLSVSATLDGTEFNTAQELGFENTFTPDAVHETLTGKKVLEGKTLTAGMFNFTIEQTSGDTVLDAAKTVTNEADGSINFGDFEFAHAGEYVFSIKEVNDGKTGYTYDSNEYVWKVNVTANQDNTLSVQTTLNDGNATEVVFNNSYKPLPVSLSGDNVIKATKKIDGRPLSAEEFTFELLDDEGNVVASAKNDAKGNVVFASITYSAVGDYHYTMVEKGESAGGVTYDKTIYDVYVKVTDQDGQLVAQTSYAKQGSAVTPAFENTYKAQAVDVILTAQKELKNRELRDGEFTFELLEDGKVIATSVNDQNGFIVFDQMTFNEVGEHNYILREVKGTDKTVTYDDTQYEIKISVTDEGYDGQLDSKITVVNDKDGDNVATFSNTYTEPEILVPDTSDNNITLLVSIAAACATGLMITLVLKRKIRHN